MLENRLLTSFPREQTVLRECSETIPILYSEEQCEDNREKCIMYLQCHDRTHLRDNVRAAEEILNSGVLGWRVSIFKFSTALDVQDRMFKVHITKHTNEIVLDHSVSEGELFIQVLIN